ncbi:hypothetical protein MVEN_00697600 [Mycena venus]|uniref:DUF6534 domain-containing protein n=1 Tax=Mycena venus TaxID=2733690 RepID=A0A8H6YEM7_9AGAR|nr:hypothetical protein MVEN_00697600 [Mycena venus]
MSPDNAGFTLTGVTINTYLMGVIMSQFFTYWTSKYQDPLVLVAFLFIINATQALAVIYMLWFYCVTNFTNPNAIAIEIWPYPFTALTMSILALVNHTFQSSRIYRFTRSKILVAFLLVISFANCGIGVTVAIEMWVFSKLSDLVALQPIIESNLALQCAIDASIATTLTVMFSRWRTNFFADTDKLLNRLIRTAVQSGFFTAVFALGTLLSSRFSPGTYMVSLFALPIGRIYTHANNDGPAHHPRGVAGYVLEPRGPSLLPDLQRRSKWDRPDRGDDDAHIVNRLDRSDKRVI